MRKFKTSTKETKNLKCEIIQRLTIVKKQTIIKTMKPQCLSVWKLILPFISISLQAYERHHWQWQQFPETGKELKYDKTIHWKTKIHNFSPFYENQLENTSKIIKFTKTEEKLKHQKSTNWERTKTIPRAERGTNENKGWSQASTEVKWSELRALRFFIYRGIEM